MDQLVCASLSHTHYWYEVGMLKVPAVYNIPIGYGCQSYSWSAEQENINISLSPFAPENLVSRDGFGSFLPRQPAHLHTQAESVIYLRDSSRISRRRPFIYLNHHTPSGRSRVYRATHLRTDGVHCRRESTGTGPVNLKVVSNGCCLGRLPWTN